MSLGIERRQCPPEFQERIDARFGLNHFGGHKFKVVWGHTATMTVSGFNGYEQRLLCAQKECWNILRWRAPEVYGTPELYYSVNHDDATGLCFVGEYPYEGRYEVLQPLMSKEFVDGELVITPYPLSHMIIERAIPLLIRAEEATDMERRIAIEENKRREDEAETNEIADRMMDDLPRWYGPVSYSRQGCRTALIDRYMEKIQREWNVLDKAPTPQRGFRQLA